MLFLLYLVGNQNTCTMHLLKSDQAFLTVMLLMIISILCFAYLNG